MRILLVDDDPIFTELLLAHLGHQGLTDVETAASADAALQLADQARLPYECLLLDIQMEGMNGIELCREMRTREEYRNAPIIMITSGDPAQYMNDAFAAGATDFMQKPLNVPELIGRMNMAMLLVDTLKKERWSRETIREMIARPSGQDQFDPAERFTFTEVAGMVDFFQLENRILRMQSGLYALSLFRIQIQDFAAIGRFSDRGEMQQLLHAVSTVIAHSVNERNLLISYMGHGRFAICVLGRTPIVLPLLQLKLAENVEAVSDLIPDLGERSLTLKVSAMSSRRILSTQAALELLEQEMNSVTQLGSTDLPRVEAIEENIFRKAKLLGERPRPLLLG
ncbi:response regulator [Roseovarius sp. C7]|uniref:response regulator n=1 Tax=Roseovarius sp. C7 TaxID=3398643 RepID=UPI0039F68A0A